MRGDTERRHAVHEAGGETPEAAIAERGVRFDPTELRQTDAEFFERLGHWFRNTEIGHRVEQKAADEELEGEVIDPLAAVGVDFRSGFQPAVDNNVPGGKSDGEKPVARAGHLGNLAHRVGQFRKNGGFQFSRGAEFARFRGLCPSGCAEIVHCPDPHARDAIDGRVRARLTICNMPVASHNATVSAQDLSPRS